MKNILKTQLSKKQIALNFSNAAHTYDKWALPQEKIANSTINLIPQSFIPEQIIDLGCGTGNLIDLLINKFPESHITGIDIADGMIDYCKNKYRQNKNIEFINNDIEDFSRCNCYDLAVSSFSLQWISNPVSTFSKIHKMLTNHGFFIFSLPIIGTLHELSNSYKELLNRIMFGIKYKNKDFYTKILQQCSFEIIDSEIISTYGYFNNLDVFRYFKHTGTMLTNMHNEYPLKISEINSLMTIYKNRHSRKDGSIPVTYRVLYIVARKTINELKN